MQLRVDGSAGDRCSSRYALRQLPALAVLSHGCIIALAPGGVGQCGWRHQGNGFARGATHQRWLAAGVSRIAGVAGVGVAVGFGQIPGV